MILWIPLPLQSAIQGPASNGGCGEISSDCFNNVSIILQHMANSNNRQFAAK